MAPCRPPARVLSAADPEWVARWAGDRLEDVTPPPPRHARLRIRLAEEAPATTLSPSSERASARPGTDGMKAMDDGGTLPYLPYLATDGRNSKADFSLIRPPKCGLSKG